ncbi:MAG: DUF4918 family protein [Ignavibacteriae bacterium]|nr:DUF4918 family protein [Ignavibacteriota bacterium]NOH00391.1 DUF4918 family protein [Ignavibacteriota bacterium]
MRLYEKILSFYQTLKFDKSLLPSQVEVMNPYFDNSGLLKESIKKFYQKFYNDNEQRKIILGINPGRHGAGVTGIPFTDTKRLNSECGIIFKKGSTHEPSSVFVYDMIKAYGGVNKFYKDFYISSVSPLGFVKVDNKGKETNFNYYDQTEFMENIKPFVLDCLRKQLDFGIQTKECYCLGNGDNFNYLNILNSEYSIFESIIPLAHPRYIQQYKSKNRDQYISEYIEALRK